ncbi:MAG: transcriptional regulator GcvA [Marinibacterium sp.]|nr:transcriptional regulator GcvA [Marinibacterium sp.]
MSDRLPPLTALRAFDAAARHMSFARAAEELNVTPAALSFQIKSLEDHLGQPLFIRLNRAVELTPAGKTLAPGAAEGFAALLTAWSATRRLQDTQSLTVTAGPAFTSKWLAPRIYDFARAHPEIELRITASLRLLDFARDDVDVAIRFGFGDDKDIYSMPLTEEWVTPVTTPELAAKYPTPQSLTEAPLLFDDNFETLGLKVGWATWFKHFEVEYKPTHGAHFSQHDHMVDAALAGAGIAMGRRSMVVTELHQGRLVAPYGVAMMTGARFRFLCRLGAESRPQIAAFRDWILAEIDRTAFVLDELEMITPESLPD